MLYGVTGSGKTTAAARISAATGIACTCVDDLTWEAGWVQVCEEEQRRRIEEVCARDSWLLDSAYGAWLDVVLARVELIVALDYPRWLSLGRLLRRTVGRALDKRPVCNGNTESVRQMLGAQSIIRWHFRSFTGKRERIAAWAVTPPREGTRVLRFRSPRELDAWVRTLGERSAADKGGS